jgi:hypothetical protein
MIMNRSRASNQPRRLTGLIAAEAPEHAILFANGGG